MFINVKCVIFFITLVLQNILIQGQVNPNHVCGDPNAIEPSCFNEKTQDISKGGTYERHEKILVKMKQKEGACNFEIRNFRLFLSEPPKIPIIQKPITGRKRRFVNSVSLYVAGEPITSSRDSEKAEKETLSPGYLQAHNPSHEKRIKREFSDLNEQTIRTGILYQNSTFTIQPYTVTEVGAATLRFYPMRDPMKPIAEPVNCTFTVNYSKARAVLIGGSEKTYKPNKDAIIDASRSENLNEKKYKSKNLTFDWRCEHEKSKRFQFCQQDKMEEFKNQNKINIPAKFARDKNVFKIVVTVGITNIPNPGQYVDSTSQTVRFSALSIDLIIRCIKNCAPITDVTLPGRDLILKAICDNCESISDNYHFKWTIIDSNHKESVDYGKLRDPNRGGETFYLKSGALVKNEIYTVTVKTRGDSLLKLAASFTLETIVSSPLNHCSMEPQSGVAFKTKFKAKCVYFPGDNTFEVFSVKGADVVLLSRGKVLEDLIFYLPAGATVWVNMTDNKNGYIQLAKIEVQVEEALKVATKTDKEINNAVKGKMDEVMKLSKTGSPELGLQGLAAIVGEYSDLPEEKKDLQLELDQMSVKTLESININSPERAQQATNILSRIVKKYPKNPDPNLSLEITEICSKAGRIIMEDAKQMKNAAIMDTQMINRAKSLSACSQAGLGENHASVEPDNITVPLPTTEYPILNMKNIPENYEDYTDDVRSGDNMAKFETASIRMKQMCFTNAKMIALTLVPEEEPLVSSEGSMSIVSVRRYCEDIMKTRIDSNNVSLHPSNDCKKSPVIDIMMCVVDKNPYWWKNNIPMITKTVFMKFERSDYVDGQKLTENVRSASSMVLDNFKDPFNVTFRKLENIFSAYDIHEAPLPKRSISDLDENSFYEEVSTHRIFHFKNRGFSVNFENITEDDYFDVVLTEFQKPSYDYFKSNHRIMYERKTIIEVNTIRKYDSFWYLSVLRNENMIADDRSYFFSVATLSCHTWNNSVKAWEFACPVATVKSNNMTCYCTHGHVFTGFVSNNRVNFVENIIIQFQLEMHRCWIIFATTICTFLLFCIVLFFTSFEEKRDVLDKIYFVGDVPSFFQYAYIVMITTGKKKQAGTTSNVTIKLYGSITESLEHVLNYPDPEMLMLQRNTEIWFVLATEKCLGNLEKLEIWFDSLGNNTKWYGSKIEIYDIQQKVSWEFDVENWFDVMLDEHNAFTITPKKLMKDDKSRRSKREIVLKAVASFLGKTTDTVNLWNLRARDPILLTKERVTIMFSTIMTLFVSIMFLYKLPTFSETDSLDPNEFGFNEKLIWISFLGSIFAFGVHFPIIHFVKRDKIQIFRRRIRIEPLKISLNFAVLSWLIITASITMSITMLVVCGFWIPLDTSLLWLVSVMIGIFFNALVLQSLSSIIYIYWLRIHLEVESFANALERIIRFIELQRTWIYKRFGSLSLRPYFQHLYYRLDFVTLRDRIKSEDTKRKIKEILQDLVMFLIYITLLYLVLMLDKEPLSIYSHRAVKNLVQGRLVRSKIRTRTIKGVENYMNNSLISSIQALQWYGKFVEDNPGMTKDFSNKYLGIIRIRQHRTREIPCVVPKIMEYLNMTCRPDFYRLKEFRDFSRQWNPATELTRTTTERMAGSWKYSRQNVTGTAAHYGKFSIYPGGGYVSKLGRTMKNSKINLKYLKKFKWLDLRTRAILIEFLLYNPNVNLFNTIQMTFEISAAGHIIPSIGIQTRKLIMVDNHAILTKKVMNSGFVIILSIMTLRIIYKAIRNRRRFFHDVWSLFDILIVILSIASIFMYYGRLASIKKYVEDLTKSNNNEFINYFHLFIADNLLSTLSSTLVFMSTFRLWKLLRFMIIVQVAEKTLRDAAVPLLHCLLYHSLLITAFAICGTLFFGADSEDFLDFPTTLITLILLSINLFPGFNIGPIKKHPLGILYFTLYSLSSLFFITLYIAIITLYYADAKDFYADQKGYVTKYVQEKLIYLKTLLKIRIHNLRGGADDSQAYERIIQAKVGERYEDCFTVPKSRVRAMALITMCVLRNEDNPEEMADKDFYLMSRMVKALFDKESSEKDIFFITGDSHHIDIVDNRRLVQIADICERLAAESRDIIRVPRRADKTFHEFRMERIISLIDNVNTIRRALENVKLT